MIRIASYNIRKAIASDRRRRPDRIVEILGELGADIVALQEADRRFGARQSAIPQYMLNEHGGYHAVPLAVRDGSLGWHGNAILVRPGVEVLRHAPLTLPALEPRGAVLADLAIKGRRLRVVGMHLDLSGLWRRRQVRTVLAHLDAMPDRLPTVLMGDLNEWNGNAGCLRDLGQHHRALALGPSFHARRPVGRLDRIFVGPEFRVGAAGVHQSPAARSASDHLPVWADLYFA